MAEGIIDKIMQTFKGMEKDEATLTTIAGGQKVDLFTDNTKISRDFNTIMEQVFLSDKAGKERYGKLVKSGGMEKLRELWEMGGAPGLNFGDPKNYGKGASFTGVANNDPIINIHEGANASSQSKFDYFIAELAHGIGFNNPSMMKLGATEWEHSGGGVTKIQHGETAKFLNTLDIFPKPENPSDSLAVFDKWWKSQPEDIQFPGEHEDIYAKEGHAEQITHSRIETALRLWLESKQDIPWREGHNLEEW